MKLLVLSDLHVEFRPYTPDPEAVAAADVVILAGDIHKGVKAIEWAREAFPDKQIVQVAGNHEFYGGHWDVTLQQMRDAARALDVHFLERDVVTIDDVRFVGCTLWVDFDVFGADARELAMHNYQEGMNDCHKIRATPVHLSAQTGYTPAYSRLRATHVRSRHQGSVKWLTEVLADHQSACKTVVVTHHLPRTESIPERYRGHRLTPGFVSQLDRNLMAQAQLWIHGHIHDSVDYILEGTSIRVVCNPRGYPIRGGNENAQFAQVTNIVV